MYKKNVYNKVLVKLSSRNAIKRMLNSRQNRMRSIIPYNLFEVKIYHSYNVTDVMNHFLFIVGIMTLTGYH